jgi:hypothetical protein
VSCPWLLAETKVAPILGIFLLFGLVQVQKLELEPKGFHILPPTNKLFYQFQDTLPVENQSTILL